MPLCLLPACSPGGTAAEQVADCGRPQGLHVMAERRGEDTAFTVLHGQGHGVVFVHHVGVGSGEDVDRLVTFLEIVVELIVGLEVGDAFGDGAFPVHDGDFEGPPLVMF